MSEADAVTATFPKARWELLGQACRFAAVDAERDPECDTSSAAEWYRQAAAMMRLAGVELEAADDDLDAKVAEHMARTEALDRRTRAWTLAERRAIKNTLRRKAMRAA